VGKTPGRGYQIGAVVRRPQRGTPVCPRYRGIEFQCGHDTVDWNPWHRSFGTDLSWDEDAAALLGPPPLLTQQPLPRQQPPPQRMPPQAQPPSSPARQPLVPSPNLANKAEDLLNLSNDSAASWDSAQGGSLTEQASRVIEEILTPQRMPRDQNLENTPPESGMSVTRSGRPIRPPYHYSPTLHHIEAHHDLVEVLAAKIAAKLGVDRSSAKVGAAAPAKLR
jgi:hypothetical protein